MNFLITGAAGFLGSALANHLALDGHQVRGLDNLSTGNPQALDRNVHFTQGDINDRPKLWTLLQNVDCVFHLAARVSVPESIMFPREYNAVNVGGTVSLMESIRDVGVRRVIFISSGTVYGLNVMQPLHEQLVPHPASPYAVSKLAAESYVRTLGNLSGIETVSLRVFNAYGPGQYLPASHPPAVPNFLRQAVRNGTLVINGDGHQTRDYVFLDDTIRAMIAAATAPDLDGFVINIGSGVEISTRRLAQHIMEITDSKAEIIFNPRSSAGVESMCADLTLAKEKLGFKPLTSLEDGLRLTIQRDARFQQD
ncbi:MAG: NAD-dependent epimerase/dehydratase family protein [Chloroflexi bacterium]|nr:NAD-dependent epimerase/dehydratase family protein [Chloroflexota bacterium]